MFSRFDMSNEGRETPRGGFRSNAGRVDLVPSTALFVRDLAVQHQGLHLRLDGPFAVRDGLDVPGRSSGLTWIRGFAASPFRNMGGA